MTEEEKAELWLMMLVLRAGKIGDHGTDMGEDGLVGILGMD